MANYARDKEHIHKQLALAKETLVKLRALTDSTNTESFNGQNGDFLAMNGVNEWDNYGDDKHDSDEGGSSGLGIDSPSFDHHAHETTYFLNDKSAAARDSLARVLGVQVSKLEDDLKMSLLAYFEQMETQKEELISSFETMHAQLLKHQEICQQHRKEEAERDAFMERLKAAKQTLEMDVETLKRENLQMKSASRTRENGIRGYRISPGYVEPDELSETLMKENSRLREKLRKLETTEYARLERKVALQEKLCESYNKDMASKDKLLKRLQAENQGLHEDVKNLQDEVLRVNANRLNAEQDKTRLQQELQFSEEQINTLREKLSSSAEEGRYLQRCISDANSKVNISGDNLSELEKEILALRGKCESYRDKLNDKERFLESVTKEHQGLLKAVEAMKRELSAVRGEERALKVENERLQKENADREIDRLSSETTSEAHSGKISKMKQQMQQLQGKVDELERQRKQHDDREAELNQEVLANLEKYTRIEQQLYLAKKELAQVRGFYDTSKENKRDLQAEVDESKARIASLERKLQAKQLEGEDENQMNDVMKNNQELNQENARLRDDFQTCKTETEELEEALQSAREQNSLQRMRLDAHETLMKRKDERIKELQNELLELHDQMNTLTDEILKKNREMEGLRMAKMLLDQELDLLKSGKLSARSLNREGVTKDGFALHHTADPASPDSGFSDMEREKDIDRLRREILSHGKFHPKQSVLHEENIPLNEEDKTNVDLALQTRRLKETEKRLADVIAQNEDLKDREQEARSLQLQMDKELRKVTEENKELKEREKMLAKALEEQQNILSQDKSIAPQQEEEISRFVDEPVETSILEPILEASPENSLISLENEPQERLIDLNDELDSRTSQPFPEKTHQLQNRTQELEVKLHDYETSLAKMAAEKEQLLSELEQAQESLQEIENECKTVQENKEELQQIMQEELSAKDEEVAKLQKELSVLCEQKEDLKGFVNSSKEASSQAEDQLLRAQNLILDYEKQQELSRNKEKSLRELLSQSEETNANLQVQLGKAKQQRSNAEQAAKDLQQQMLHVQQGSAALEREVQELREKVAQEQEKQKELCERLEKSCHAEEQLLKAQDVIRNLERQQGTSHDREKSLQEHLNQSEENNANLQVRIGETERDYLNTQQEAKGLQQQLSLVQQGSAELEHELKDLREKIAREEEKLEKASENLKDMQTENEELRQQLEDANNNLENSLQENRHTVLELQEDIREKDNHIEQLQEELTLAEQRHAEIKNLSSNNQTEISDLQAELIETKEQFYTVSQEKTRLTHSHKDLEQTVAEKEEKILALELEKSEGKRIISEQEQKVEELVDKLEDFENENSKLRKENNHFKVSLEEASKTQQEMEKLLEESHDEAKVLEQQLSAAHESITDLETAFERGEDKNSQMQENLRDAKERITKLEAQLEQSQRECRALEKDCHKAQKEFEKAQASLDSYQEKIASLEKKLRAAEKTISDLEMARDNGLSNEQLLQQRFANAREKVDKTETENSELKEKLTRMERKLGDSLSKQEALEDKREELEKINNEISHDLEYERERRLALKQKLEAKDRENDVIQRKVQLLEKNKAENEDIQHKDMEEKTKLRDELSRTKKTLSELEATRETQEENITEMEDVLRETRAKIGTLEQKLEDSTRDNADLNGQLEELNRKLKYTKEENVELEKRLLKQKEISDEFRNNLAEREESALNSNYNRDAAERALQSVKKELARKDAKLKMQKEQIDDMEVESEKAARKNKETEASYKKVCNENERLTKELADVKATLAKLEALYKEKANIPVESEVKVARVSELQANPVEADKLIRDWSDKLNTAQNKVTDLENELLRDIKKHEMRVHGTRPASHDWRRRSADGLGEYGRLSRARTRHRSNRSRDSSVDSLRSTQSMFDYIDESIAVTVRSEKQDPNNIPDSKERSPVDSDNEGLSGIPVVKVIPSETVNLLETDMQSASVEGEFSKKLNDEEKEASDLQSVSPTRDDAPVLWEPEATSELHIDYQSPAVLEAPPGPTTATEDVFDVTKDLPTLLFTDSPSVEETSTDMVEDPFDVNPEDVLDLHIDYHPQIVTEPPPDTTSSTDMAKNVFHVRTDDAVDQQSAHQQSNDYQQPLLIEPPSDDLFHFGALPSDNSSLTNVTDLTFRSPSPPVFSEHSLLVSFDPLDQPQPHRNNNNNEELLDPFEELMRMKEAHQDDNKNTDMYDLDDVTIDVTDDANTEAGNDGIINVITDIPHCDVDDTDGDVSNSLPTSISSKYHVSDGAGGDVVDSLEQIVPVPYSQKETMTDLGHDRSKGRNAASSDHMTHRDNGDDTAPSELVKPVPRPRKIQDKMKPALWPQESKKERSESDGRNKTKPDAQPYSVMIMVDDEIVKPPSDRNSNPTQGGARKQKGGIPERLVLEEEQEVYKSPSQIRKELEQASKESQQEIPQNTKRTQKELKQNPEKEPKQRHWKKAIQTGEKAIKQKSEKERKQKPGKEPKQKTEKEQKLNPDKEPKLKPGNSGNTSTQYHIEEKRHGNSNSNSDQGQESEQEEVMGKGRLKKLIAAFNK